jgi:hypothetical protein
LGLNFAIGTSICYGHKEIFLPGLALRPARCKNNGVIFRHMTNSFARPPAAAIGALLAVATIPLNLLLLKAPSEQFAAMILAVMGAMYIGFGLQKGNRTQIATEVTVATGFFTAALAALWITPWIVPVAYVAHGIWDYAHHQGSKLASVPVKLVAIPLWYPSFCALYDWVAAASLAVIWDLRV